MRLIFYNDMSQPCQLPVASGPVSARAPQVCVLTPVPYKALQRIHSLVIALRSSDFHRTRPVSFREFQFIAIAMA